MRIAPSILAADFADLSGEVEAVDSVELLHLDVMDGHFVPNISFGPPVIESLRSRTDVYFDTHLMIEQPERYVDTFEAAGADRLTVHAEACEDTAAVVDQIHDAGLDAGVAINPDTPVETIEPLLEDIDLALVMTVQPGFGGQSFMHKTVEKVEKIAAISDVEIEVDGGVDAETGPQCAKAGADTFVIGSSLFGRDDASAALSELRAAIGIDAE
ncbi:ribulose-phosphate 3-epimerase [Halorhabdus salina]|uniref:ribulose-phosphate 3-epimerase n=1 Tax=Halorhabdus salina TaxID=2750670 RepID=UPI0015EE414C|nr:ribulose-phosphate 3-epimerase [Halorhabdus salina]